MEYQQLLHPSANVLGTAGNACHPFNPTNRVQGFLAAGHVCAVMGYHEYLPIAEQYQYRSSLLVLSRLIFYRHFDGCPTARSGTA
jgi:hydrogenase maturation factor